MIPTPPSTALTNSSNDADRPFPGTGALGPGTSDSAASNGSPGAAKTVIDIRPAMGWQAIDVRELWRYRELLYTLTSRDLKVRYRQTLLGMLWVVGQPLIATILFTLVFNRVARIEGPAGIPYPVFVLSGLIPWTFFASGVQSSSNSLVGSTHLISKIYFPRLLIPASAVVSGAVDFAVTFILIGLMMAWYGLWPGAAVLLVPLTVVLLFSLTVGAGFWLSALNVEYRDIRVLVPFLMQVGLYVTPVAYPRELLPGSLARLAIANPMTGIVETFRAAVIGTPVEWDALILSIAFSALLLVSGALFFRRTERTFADLL
jgi:lipopolysaccharide transport system permease protein